MNIQSVIDQPLSPGIVSIDTAGQVFTHKLRHTPLSPADNAIVLDLASPLYNPGATIDGGSKIYDRSGYGNHGTITGATWERNNQGLYEPLYDGADDSVTLDDAGAGSSLNFTTEDFTIRCWLTMTNLPTDDASSNTIAIRGTFNQDGWLLMYPYTGITMRWLISQAGAFQDVRSNDVSSLISVGVPHMMTAIRSGDTGVFYINDTSIGLSLGGGTIIDPVSNATATVLGRWVINYPQDAKMSSMDIRNRALSSTEVAGLFNQERHLLGV